MPATLKTASILPNRSRQAETALWIAASSRTSAAAKLASANSAASDRHSSESMPITNTGLSAAHMRTVAAAIPDEPVIRRTCFTVLLEQVFEALPICLVKHFQLFRGAGIANELMTWQHNGLNSALEHALRRGAADHINDHGASDG